MSQTGHGCRRGASRVPRGVRGSRAPAPRGSCARPHCAPGGVAPHSAPGRRAPATVCGSPSLRRKQTRASPRRVAGLGAAATPLIRGQSQRRPEAGSARGGGGGGCTRVCMSPRSLSDLDFIDSLHSSVSPRIVYFRFISFS